MPANLRDTAKIRRQPETEAELALRAMKDAVDAAKAAVEAAKPKS